MTVQFSLFQLIIINYTLIINYRVKFWLLNCYLHILYLSTSRSWKLPQIKFFWVKVYVAFAGKGIVISLIAFLSNFGNHLDRFRLEIDLLIKVNSILILFQNLIWDVSILTLSNHLRAFEPLSNFLGTSVPVEVFLVFLIRWEGLCWSIEWLLRASSAHNAVSIFVFPNVSLMMENSLYLNGLVLSSFVCLLLKIINFFFQMIGQDSID
jgi:hypothetical protein